MDTTDLLRDVAARLLAPGGPWMRSTRAAAIVRGTVTRSEVIAHPPTDAFLADPDVGPLAVDGPGGRMLFVCVVELTADRWIAGPGGATATGVWLAPQVMTSHTVTLPLPATQGIALLDELPATAIGRELRLAVAGAFALEPLDPVLLPDDDGATTLALELARDPAASPTASPAAWTRALAQHGGALQLALGAAIRTGAVDALRARSDASRVGADDGDPLEAVLVRAARLAAGDATAADGFDLGMLDVRTLRALAGDPGTPFPWPAYNGEPHERA